MFKSTLWHIHIDSGSTKQSADPHKKRLGVFSDILIKHENEYKEYKDIQHGKSVGKIISCEFCFKR